jgi:HK97 family phage prohead protease
MDELEKLKKAHDEIDRRTFPVREFRAVEKDGRTVLEGYAAVFNEYSQDLGGFVEIIEPGFFDDVMGGDTRSLWNHNAEKVLGRTISGTLEISQDERGLYQRTYPPVVPPDAATWAQDALVTIKRGDVDQQSFAFRVKRTYRGDDVDGDEWYVLGDVVVRRLKKGGCRELLDVSPVTYPAYVQTDVSASTRSRFEEFKESIPSQVQGDGQQAEWQEPLDSLKRRLELKSND